MVQRGTRTLYAARFKGLDLGPRHEACLPYQSGVYVKDRFLVRRFHDGSGNGVLRCVAVIERERHDAGGARACRSSVGKEYRQSHREKRETGGGTFDELFHTVVN